MMRIAIEIKRGGKTKGVGKIIKWGDEWIFFRKENYTKNTVNNKMGSIDVDELVWIRVIRKYGVKKMVVYFPNKNKTYVTTAEKIENSFCSDQNEERQFHIVYDDWQKLSGKKINAGPYIPETDIIVDYDERAKNYE